MIDKILTFDDILHIMNWKKTKGYEMCRRKDFPAFKDGKEWKILESKLQQWLELKSNSTSNTQRKTLNRFK